jgi:hypothetical protein
MSGTGINQAHKGRIQEVQTQKSPKQQTSGLIAQKRICLFIAGLASATNHSRPATQKDCAATKRDFTQHIVAW